MKIARYFFLLICIWGGGFWLLHAQSQYPKKLRNASDTVRIDKIVISKNWLTWDRIIKNEITIQEGEVVRKGQIDTTLMKVWNIGNFANVDYVLDSAKEGVVLNIQALDAVMVFPILVINHSSAQEYQYKLGLADNNFLGSNTRFSAGWDKRPTGALWHFNVNIPRQFLYRNMTIGFGSLSGLANTIFWDRKIVVKNGKKTGEYTPVLFAPYKKFEIYTDVGSPWQQDFTYQFSPNVRLGFRYDQIDYSILSDEELAYGLEVPEAVYRFLDIGVSESIGSVKRERHRMDGAHAGISYGFSWGLGPTKSYHRVNIGGGYYKIANKIVQYSLRANTGFVSAKDHYRYSGGSGEVTGLRSGELYGRWFYSAYAGVHFTWLNSKWITIENKYFANFANAKDKLVNWFQSDPKYSVGTTFELKSPILTFLSSRLTFMYAGPGADFFNFVF